MPRIRVLWLLTVLSAGPALGQPAPGASLSPRNASYDIDVRLDHAGRRLSGRQVLTWRNVQQLPTDELRFHLYWNAWRNSRSTWMLEDRLRQRSDLGERVEVEDWAWIEVRAARLLADGSPGSDLLASRRYLAPDDGNRDDRTVMALDLPRPVPPGATIRVELEWEARIPRTFARTGFRGDYYFFAHWFPKLGVFEGERWNCPQYHAATEYFSDYGVYDVRMTVPAGFVLGATGRETDRRDNPDGTVTHRYVQEDVHAFAWTASPDYVERRQRFEEPGLPAVDMRLLIQPEHLRQADRHFDATRAALRLFGTWYGPYPYGHVTIVDPAYGSGAGGMEYPTLFTAGTRLFNPFGGGSPEGVTIHEAGHQFWYGLVGNDEFASAWIDEGLNTFSTERVYREAYGEEIYGWRYFVPPGTELGGFFPYLFRDLRERGPLPSDRFDRYRRDATSDVPARPTWRYFPESASNITYSKTAIWLSTLERYLGWETLREILSTFFTRWQFRHPRPEDFLAVVDEVAGQDLRWFFDQVFFGDARFDYAVQSAASVPAEPEGRVETPAGLVYQAPAEAPTRYRTEVVVQRLGEGVFPVDVLMVFEDGSEVRRRWDGRYRWKLYVEERPARLAYAVVDPDRVLLLDLDYTNNSRRREAGGWLPAVKWASKWLVWLQDLLGAFAFFV